MAKKKGKPAPEPEELEDDELETEDDELEELDEDEATEAAPKKKKSKASDDDEVVFGASDLAKLASKGREKPITPRDLRTLLRKMARDGRLNREITAGNRTRYSWSGPDDPEVKKILKALSAGELEQGKQEALAKLKEQKAAKQAEKAKAEAKTKKKAKPVVEDDEDDDE
jgi:hypothetical protein